MPKFPFTNYHELNLDWILKKVNALFDASEENARTIRTYDTRLSSAEQTATSAATAATSAQQLADAAAATAGNALSVAGTADQKADSALTAATDASGAVSGALTIAQEAQQTAGAAVATANDAAATAAGLESLANTANQNATAAVETAGTAVTTANNAAAAAQTADQKAVAAQQTANSAQSAAATNAGNISTLQTDVSNLNRQISDVEENKIPELKSAFANISDIVVSRNLMPATSKTVSGIDGIGVSSTYSDGTLTFSGTATSSGDYNVLRSDAITLAPGTYTFSRSVAIAQIALRKNASTRVALLQGSTMYTTFTLSETTQVYLTIGLERGTAYNTTMTLQIETGESASSFVEPSYYYATAVDKDAREDITEIGLPYTDATLSWTSGKTFVYNLGWTNNTGWSYADVDLIQGQSLDITLHVYPTVFALSLWNDDGSSIIRACFPLAQTETDEHYVYKCSAKHEKVRINVPSMYKSSVVAKIYKPNNQVNLSNIASEKNNFECYDVLHENVIAIGDSLTQGSYTGADLHPAQSYPAFLAKLMGNTVINAGRAGWSALAWWEGDSVSKKGFPYYDYTDYDTAIIDLGTNGGLTDTLATDVDPYDDYTDYADTNTGAYCKIIEGLKAQNRGINIILCNIWAGGGDVGVSVTNTVIGKIAEKYGVQVVDLQSGFISAYGAYRAVQGNIHLGRIGYARMADLIRQALDADVMMFPDHYNTIPE